MRRGPSLLNKLKIQAVLWLVVVACSPVSAQQAISLSDEPVDLEIELPTLDSLINAALSNSPYLKFEEAQVERSTYQHRLNKREWHNNINGFYNYSLGNQRFVMGPEGSQTASNFLDGYRYGLNVNLPLSEITSRRARMKLSQAELNAAHYRRDQIEMELKKQVIAEYNNLIAAQRILRIKSNGRESTLLAFQMAEKEFRQGTLSLEEYSRMNEMMVNSEANYEMSKSAFLIQYAQFEQLIGIPLVQLMVKK